MIGNLVGNYCIIQEIGAGGMGTVYLAHHNFLKFNNEPQKAAIKILHTHLTKSEKLKERFLQEAQTQFQLHHSGITKVIDFNEDNNGLYIVLEYLEGNTLEQYISKIKGLIPEYEAKELFLQILYAVQYAHEKKVIHRDLKPSNIMITKEGTIKIMDFGIAKIMDYNNSLTKVGSKLGSPVYMSPEQVKGEKTDQRSDIYSLGVIFFEMLTGRPVYKKNETTEFNIYNNIVNEPLPRLKTFYELVSDESQWIIDKATAKDATNRFQNISEFIDALNSSTPIRLKTFNGNLPKVFAFTGILLTALIILGYIEYRNRSDKMQVDEKKFKFNISELSQLERPEDFEVITQNNPPFEYIDNFKNETLFSDIEDRNGSYKNYSSFAQISSISARNPFVKMISIPDLNYTEVLSMEIEIRFNSCNASFSNGNCSIGIITGDPYVTFSLFYGGYIELTEYNSNSGITKILEKSVDFEPLFEPNKNYRISFTFISNNLKVKIDDKNYLTAILSNMPGKSFGFKAQDGAKAEILNFEINNTNKSEL